MIQLSPKHKRIAKWVGYVLLAIFTFVFTLHLTFPYGRLKDRIIDALNDKYEVNIVSIEPGVLPGNFTIKSMTLSTRPSKPDEKPVDIYFKEIDVSIGVTSAVFWTANLSRLGVDVEASISGGTLELSIEHDKGDNTIAIAATTKNIPIGVLPGVKEAVGLPMTGGLSADLNVELPKGKWDDATGEVKISCLACTVGDGVAKLKMKPPPGRRISERALAFQGDGVTVPKLNLGAVLGKVKIKKGLGTIETFGAKSEDGFLKVDGEIEFKSPFKETLFPGCIRFGFSDALKAREPKFMAIEAGIPPQAKQDDGTYALPTLGPLVNLRINKRGTCDGGGGESDEDDGRVKKSRTFPRITTQPDDKPVKTRTMPDPSDDTEGEEEDDSADDGSDDEVNTEPGPTLRRLDMGETPDDVGDPDPEPEEERPDEPVEEEAQAEEESPDQEGDGEEELTIEPEEDF